MKQKHLGVTQAALFGDNAWRAGTGPSEKHGTPAVIMTNVPTT
jgi:hypothetical protein